MSDGTFDERIGQLIARVGEGVLNAKVEFDQIYAHRQHFELGWAHPEGGEALYLQNALLERTPLYMEMIAEGVLDSPEDAMIAVAEDLAEESAKRAPREFGFLAESAHPSVADNGVPVYDRPAAQRRLTEPELVVLHELKYGQDHPNAHQHGSSVRAHLP